MARRRGGYRAPSNPAAVSGPGSLSQRTDQGPTDYTGLDYGENRAVNEQQRAAPLAGEPQPQSQQQRQVSGLTSEGIFTPTQRPDEPLTAGTETGAALAEDPYEILRVLADMAPNAAARATILGRIGG